jgi:hypothetical protein
MSSSSHADVAAPNSHEPADAKFSFPVTGHFVGNDQRLDGKNQTKSATEKDCPRINVAREVRLRRLAHGCAAFDSYDSDRVTKARPTRVESEDL